MALKVAGSFPVSHPIFFKVIRTASVDKKKNSSVILKYYMIIRILILAIILNVFSLSAGIAVTEDSISFISGCYSPAKEKIVFFARRVHHRDDISGNPWNPFTRVPKDSHSYFEEGLICLFDLESKQIAIILRTDRTPDNFSWEGNSIVYEVKKAFYPSIYHLQVDSKTQEEIVENGKQPVISPDASKIVYIRHIRDDLPDEVRVINIDKTRDRLLTNLEKVSRLFWEGNETLLLYGQSDESCYRISVSTGEVTKIQKPFPYERWKLISSVKVEELVANAANKDSFYIQ